MFVIHDDFSDAMKSKTTTNYEIHKYLIYIILKTLINSFESKDRFYHRGHRHSLADSGSETMATTKAPYHVTF